MTEEEDLEDLRISTRKVFDECVMLINYIEAHPIAHDATYTEIMKSSRDVFGKASKARLMIRSDPYEANPPITFALDHLKEQREMLDRLLAQDAENPTIAAIQDMAKQEVEHHKENMSAHGETHAQLQKKRNPSKKIKRTYRKAAVINGIKLTAKHIAGVLNKAKFQPEKGAGWMGACTAKKIQQWDDWCADHLGEHNLWGYMTEFRTDEKRFDDLKRFCRNWMEFWKTYKAAFLKWRTKHPDNPRENFRPSKALMKRFDIDPDRMGKNEDGGILIRPASDDEKRRLRR